MRKIFFFSLFLILFLFSSQASAAFEDTAERYISAPSEIWTVPTGSLSKANDPTGIPGNSVLYGQAPFTSGTTLFARSLSTVDYRYISWITKGGNCNPDCGYVFSLDDPATGNSLLSFTVTNPNVAIPANTKLEIILSGSYYNLYANGTLLQSKVNPGINSNVKFSLGTYSPGNWIETMYFDDVTDGSCIGIGKIWYENANFCTYTWSAQLLRSYTSPYSISLYSITNPDNVGYITSWNIPADDNSSSLEHGYLSFSRSNILGEHFGLYLLEMTRESVVLTDTYFYYDQLSGGSGFPEILFLAGSDVKAEIRDDSNNGGTISNGGSVYLYPDIVDSGVYNISYDILETPYSIEAEVTKIYNNTALNGTNIHFTGLSSQNYYVSVDGTAINGTNGSDTWNYMVTWGTLDSHIVSFALDYTLPGVYGYIKNSETQNPIKSATVAISNGSVTEYLFTDDNGMYYFTQGMVPGAYNVTASKSGYTTSAPYSITTQDGSTTRQDIFLDPESGAGVYYASHDVTFTVLEYWYSSAGLPGVTYAVYDNENESVKNGTTGSKGTFTVKDMDAGKNYTFILTYNNQTYTEYLEPGLTEYNLILNKEGIVHQYYNSWLNLTYAENSNNATIIYTSNKTVSAASLSVTASNGTIVQSNTLNTTSGTFTFNFTEGDYILQFDIEASDGSTASQAWSISSPSEVNLFPDSYPTWLKNTLFVAIIIIFLLAFGKSKNDIACGSVAVLTSLGYYFEWLSCGFNFVVLVWIIALGAIYLHYKRTGAVG